MRRAGFGSLVFFFLLGSCSSEPVSAPPVELTIPAGATFQEVVDTLRTRGLVPKTRLFRIYAKLKGHEREVRSGQYAFSPGASWSEILKDLTEGRVLTEALTIPEGFTLKQMAPRIAAITGEDADSVLSQLTDSSAAEAFAVPGPGLEGYLFPDTYRFAAGAPLSEVLNALTARYRVVWDSVQYPSGEPSGLTERETITLASIVQAEARRLDEMPIIASVYHNRLRIGIPLQADPTVLYALGGGRERLLYAAMDSVADHPYNTYTHPGLPPGPIGAPGLAAIDGTLRPADTDFLYFVARTNGTHIFSRTLAEHNRAVAQIRVEWDQYRREQREGAG